MVIMASGIARGNSWTTTTLGFTAAILQLYEDDDRDAALQLVYRVNCNKNIRWLN